MIKILVVDDESEIVDQIKEYLDDEGFQVFTAETGQEGIEIGKREMPNLLILDMKLPDMPGILVLKTLKEIHPKMKVITITGYIDQAMFDQAEELGRDTFIQKPFDLETLRKEVAKLVNF